MYLSSFNSILLSLITVGSALAIQSSTNSDGIQQQQAANGNNTTIATPSDLAAQQVLNNLSNTAQTVLDGLTNVNPTITIPHGTRIKVFVNQDLIFPREAVTSNNNAGVVFVR